MNRIAIVISTVGFHWEELYSAYWVYIDAGATVSLYTVNGKAPKPDPMSLKPTGPASLMGLGMPSSIAPETERGRALLAKLETTVLPLSEMNPDQVDALYLPGGHGCLFDVNSDKPLHDVIHSLFDKGRLLAAVCHATSTFAFVKHNGRSIIEGKKITGFPHALDKVLIAAGLVDKSFLPLPMINDDELQKANADHSFFDEAKAMVNPMHWVSDLPFITGMGPKSAGSVGAALVKALNEKSDMARS
ncbi:MAG: hypothetical protein EOP10_04755 [Proteobacteria bacterium]|nr:MAG: hypothetical protein EOP10_04755 [Pseudomonadota bacterium]